MWEYHQVASKKTAWRTVFLLLLVVVVEEEKKTVDLSNLYQ